MADISNATALLAELNKKAQASDTAGAKVTLAQLKVSLNCDFSKKAQKAWHVRYSTLFCTSIFLCISL